MNLEEMIRETGFSNVPNFIKVDGRITPLAKLVYGDIVSLSRKLGYCKANNFYFQRLYNVKTITTISKAISSLRKYGYVTVELGRSNSRKVYPVISDYLIENYKTSYQKIEDDLLKNRAPLTDSDKYKRNLKDNIKEIENKEQPTVAKKPNGFALFFKSKEKLNEELRLISSRIYPDYKSYDKCELDELLQEGLEALDVSTTSSLEKVITDTLNPERLIDNGFTGLDKEEFEELLLSYSQQILNTLNKEV